MAATPQPTEGRIVEGEVQCKRTLPLTSVRVIESVQMEQLAAIRAIGTPT